MSTLEVYLITIHIPLTSVSYRYAMEFELPQWIHEHEAMQEVIKEVTRLTIL